MRVVLFKFLNMLSKHVYIPIFTLSLEKLKTLNEKPSENLGCG